MKVRSLLGGLVVLLFMQLVHANERLVDTSYQADKRLVKYQKSNPELSRPRLQFIQGQQVEFNLSYQTIADRWLSLDIFHPVLPEVAKQQKVKMLVMIHGGGWRSGDKSLFYPLANRLAQQGYLVVLPEYRLSIEARFPAAVEDLVAAVNWSNNRAQQEYTITKTVLIGGSSGGHLANLIGLASNDLTLIKDQLNVPIDGIISLDGLLSTVTPEALRFEDKRKNNSALALWLGGDYTTLPELWQRVSPANYLDATDPDILVISSGQSRFTAGKELFGKRHKQGFNYYQLNNVEHTFWLFEPYLTEITPLMTQFLARL